MQGACSATVEKRQFKLLIKGKYILNPAPRSSDLGPSLLPAVHVRTEHPALANVASRWSRGTTVPQPFHRVQASWARQRLLGNACASLLEQ